MNIELDIESTGAVNAAVLKEEQEQSPHTGRPIRRLEAQFRTGSDQAREQISDALSGGKVTASGDDGARFKVASHSHSYTQGSNVTTFTVEVEEVEELRCDKVVLDGTVELTPVQYSEELTDGAVVVTLVASTSGDSTDAFEALLVGQEPGRYLPVVRRGVSDEPMRMRFGRCLYRDDDGGVRTHRVVLVQDVYDDRDEQPFKGFNEPEMRRAEDAVVVLQQTVDRLLELLVANGAVSEADAAAVRDESQDVSRLGRRQFDRSEDDDDFTLD